MRYFCRIKSDPIQYGSRHSRRAAYDHAIYSTAYFATWSVRFGASTTNGKASVNYFVITATLR